MIESGMASGTYAWQVRLNLDTARFFRELTVACAEAAPEGSAALTETMESLRRREAANRQAHLAELCSLRERITRCVRPVIYRASPPGRCFAAGHP